MVEKNKPERDTESDSLMGGFKVSFWGDENMECSNDDCIMLLNINASELYTLQRLMW